MMRETSGHSCSPVRFPFDSSLCHLALRECRGFFCREYAVYLLRLFTYCACREVAFSLDFTFSNECQRCFIFLVNDQTTDDESSFACLKDTAVQVTLS